MMIGRTGALHVDQQKRNALLLASFAAGADQAENPVRVLTHGVPSLLAIDDVVIALAYGTGAQRGEIGARPGLRISLAPPILA